MGKCLDAARELEQRNADASAQRQADDLPPIAYDPETEKNVAESAARVREVDRIIDEYLMLHATEIPDSQQAWNIRGYIDSLDILDLVDSIALSDKTLSQKAGRCKQVVRWQQVSGTCADRAADEERLAQAESALAERSEAIEAEIRRLTAELKGLQRDRDLAANDVEARTNAVARLRELVPPRVAERHRRAVATLSPLRLELSEVRTKLQNARQFANIDIERDGQDSVTLQKLKLICQSNKPELLQAGVRNDELDVPGWLKFRQRHIDEIPELESRVAELTTKLEHLEAEAADSFLDVYSQD